MAPHDENKPRLDDQRGSLEKVDYEPEEELGSVGSLQAKLKKIRAELEGCKKERSEYLDGWQRCKADAINARKDTESKAARSAELLREALVHDIIPALDSFDMAAESETWAEISDGWKTGMEQVRDQLIDALRRHGIERFGKIGDSFDPVFHDIAEERNSVDGEAGSVIAVVRSGYKVGNRVLRGAHVVIKSHPHKEPETL